MLAYIDSSVIVRVVLGEPNPLAEWGELDNTVTSWLTRLEVARVQDRLVVLKAFDEEGLASSERGFSDVLKGIDFVRLNDRVLAEAARPLPVVLSALDAIHLASAILYRATLSTTRPLLFATHDVQLARAARAMKFEVIGASA